MEKQQVGPGRGPILTNQTGDVGRDMDPDNMGNDTHRAMAKPLADSIDIHRRHLHSTGIKGITRRRNAPIEEEKRKGRIAN